jgi:uncharacterized protein YbjT (DUF2867 family)
MEHDGKVVLVSGATGRQGGAVARHLLADGWGVRALTRDPTTVAAQALAAAGAQVVQGDLDRPDTLPSVLEGVYGVYSVQNFWQPAVGFDGEVRMGKHLADAARVAGVEHFVYSSVGGADRDTAIPHFESKWLIEGHLRSIGAPLTVLRPAWFMENLQWTRDRILDGVLHGMGLPAGKSLQLIAVDDIGAFAALAFRSPELFIGAEFEIAGDELTEEQMAQTLAKVIGRPVTVAPPPERAEGDEERARMWAWLAESGYQADIPALRGLLPLQTLETWLRRTGWEGAGSPPRS